MGYGIMKMRLHTSILIASCPVFYALAFSFHDLFVHRPAYRSVDSQRCKISKSNCMSSLSKKYMSSLSSRVKASVSTRLNYSDETSQRLGVAKAWSNVIDEYIKLQEGRTTDNTIELATDEVIDQVSELSVVNLVNGKVNVSECTGDTDIVNRWEEVRDASRAHDEFSDEASDTSNGNFDGRAAHASADLMQNTRSYDGVLNNHHKETSLAHQFEGRARESAENNQANKQNASFYNNESNADENTILVKEDASAWQIQDSFSFVNDDETADHDVDSACSSVERRMQRIQSLNSFNLAAKSHQIFQMQEAVQKEQKTRNIRPTPPKLNLPYNDPSQLHAIQSNAPAILLSSGPGTGKSHVLSLRIAYLLRMQLDYQTDKRTSTNNHQPPSTLSSTPDSMVILSFTNRDASRLKETALNVLFPNNVHDPYTEEWREQTSKQLWSGTMHVFALAILRKYGYSAASPLRVLPARAMRNRVSQCLRVLLNGGEDGQEVEEAELNELRIGHLQALTDVGQSRAILYQNIVRCIDLWKEALLIPSTSCDNDLEESVDGNHRVLADEHKEKELRNDCVDLAIRLGIPKSSALLALDVFPSYQAKHAAAGTADPSDLAGMAYRLLLTNNEALNLLRAKLKHIIVDEYQDVSVSQHALLRLVVRGKTDDDDCSSKPNASRSQQKRSPILMDAQTSLRAKKRPRASASLSQNYNVPNLFVAGDTEQSIYGWRAAAPILTVDGFRRDYPQGVVASLGTCYRLPKDILEASSMLLHKDEDCTVTCYDVSPAAAIKVASSIDDGSVSNNSSSVMKTNARLGESLLLSKGLQKLDSTVLIHGLWDSREEYKYIASTIRRRSKERRKAFISAINDIDGDSFAHQDQLDFTDVAVMVRSSSQMELLKEALRACGVPFVIAGNDDESSESDETKAALIERSQQDEVKAIPMKPAVLMTMHRSKGEEFDDVYLSGWSEGSFPHPDAVSSNLIHEERRLGYVAMTRARQRVVITHSLMSRTLHYSKDGSKKYVTCQVQPSRFLYELVPSKKKADGILDFARNEDEPFLNDNAGTVWNRNAGVKEFVAGRNVPGFFQKAYQQPTNSVDRRKNLRLHTTTKSKNATPILDVDGDVTVHTVEFAPGDIVFVDSKKHKLHGKIGTVIKVSKCFVFVNEHTTKQTVRIKPSFLRIGLDADVTTKALRIGLNADVTPKASELTVLTDHEADKLQLCLAKLSVQQLKGRLKKLKLPVSGRKSELINRLLGR